ncbi:hypothetical protein K7432_012338 [Basidiobolus ranarum]|uniref:Uncharacterized protein n=1 Tax=Basidiobolus ranarum TaxID=34480 RepID=A0ABR2VSJ2_9FUNG
MRSIAAIVLAAVAISQVALAFPQGITENAGDMETVDGSFIGGLFRKAYQYVKENGTGSLEGSIGGSGNGGYKSKFIPGLGGGIKGRFGAKGSSTLERGFNFKGDGDIGGSGSGGIGVGKGYGFDRTDFNEPAAEKYES